jgi:peroxiredoxin
LAAGAPAPDFSLPQLDGSELALQSFRGRKVLLVFSDPGCAPCTGLALKLEEIHNRRGDAEVLMVSRGDLEENRRWTSTHRITFPLVLQQQWEISRAYFIFATPAAYLIGEQGLIITDALVGSDAILEAISGGNTSAIAPAKTFASR